MNIISGEVIGAAIEVHRILGPGYLESVYEEAMCVEFQLRGIEFERQKIIAVQYKGVSIGQSKVDLLVKKRLIVELKAVECFTPVHKAQIMSYLQATGLELGLLINFNVPILRDGVKRIAKSVFGE